MSKIIKNFIIKLTIVGGKENERRNQKSGGGLLNKNRILLLIIVFLLIITITIGITYAFWRIDEVQQEKNVINTECLKITFNEKNGGVSLLKAYPISDEEGLKGNPYTFTITNTCENSWASYQINLETLNGSTLKEEYLKASLSVGEENKLITELTTDLEEEATIENATNAYKLLEGKLYPKQEITYDLRLWMDSEVTAEETDSMNATYESKVTIQFSYMEEPKLTDLVKEQAIEDKNIAGGNGVVKVSHEDADIAENNEYQELKLDYEMVQQNLKQMEYRYYGANPDNYVTFNEEDAGWRIIGLVNTPEGQQIKLIRTNPLDKKMGWDDNIVNDWANASLKKYLNGENAEENLSFTEKSKNMIDNVTWNLGGFDTSNWATASQYYNYERGTTVWNERPTLWQGQIGLMYPSDYGYATSGDSTYNRESCISNILVLGRENCANNDWLFYKIDDYRQWTLMPDPTYSSHACGIYERIYCNFAAIKGAIFPVLYLKPDIKAVKGAGTTEDPYILEQQ